MIEDNKIVFVAHSGKQLDCNPFAIFESLLHSQIGKSLKFVWLVKSELLERCRTLYADKTNVRFVDYDTHQAQEEVKTCSVFINNQLMIKYYNEGVRKQAGQLFINTWHGSFGLKKIPVRDSLDVVHKSCFEFDYFLANSEFESKVYKESFGKAVVPILTGHPRNDILFSKDGISDIKSSLKIDSDEKIVLWMPSARDAFDASTFSVNEEEILANLSKKFSGKWKLLYRFHRNNIEDYNVCNFKNAIDVSKYPSLNDLLRSADVLITDYSSVICDFILMGKPAFIYAPDYEQFVRFNPLYWDLEELPFGCAKDMSSLCYNIHKFDESVYCKGVQKWLDKVGCIEDGKATQRITQIILDFLNKRPSSLLNYTKIISPTIAAQLGYKKIFLTFRNIGDQIILQRALQIYSQTKKEKVLVGTMLPELWEGSNFYLVRLAEEKLHCYSKPLFDQLNELGIKAIFLSQEELIKKGSKFIRTYGPYHIVGNIASKLGIEGEVDVNLHLNLSNEEQEFGRFSKYGQKQVAIMSGGLQRYKTYPTRKLQYIVDQLVKEGILVVQVGVSKDPLLNNVFDLRSKLEIREVASVLHNSDLFVGGIGGLMHMANAVDCPSVVIYSAAEPEYIVNYDNNINVTAPPNACRLCQKGEHCPWTSPCLNPDKNRQYECIDSIDENRIIEAIHKQLNLKVRNTQKSIRLVKAQEVKGLEDYFKTGFKLIEPSYRNHQPGKLERFMQVEKYSLRDDKTCTRIKVFGFPIFSKIDTASRVKIRILFMKFYFKKGLLNISKYFSQPNVVKDELVVKAGNLDWIKSTENFAISLSKYSKNFEDEDLKTLSLALKRKRIAFLERRNTFEPLDYEIKSQTKVDEFRRISCSPVATFFNSGSKRNVYQFGRFFFTYKVGSLFGTYHRCFIGDYADLFESGKDIIDIGAGIGDSSVQFAHYLHSKVYAVEPASRMVSHLEDTITLNKGLDIAIVQKAFWSSNSPVYMTNKLNTLNCVVGSDAKNGYGCDAVTLDSFVEENSINPGLIKIMTNWGEANILKGSLVTINKYRPIIIVSLSASGKELFEILNICTSLTGYRHLIRKTSELHSTDGLFLISIPM